MCDRKDMPTVVLAKDKRTGLFTVLQRYALGEQAPPLDEWTWDPKVRHLERSDYDTNLDSTAKGQSGGLRSQQRNDQFPGLQLTNQQSSLAPNLLERFDRRDERFLETYPVISDNPSSNDTLSDILEDFDLFYAR